MHEAGAPDEDMIQHLRNHEPVPESGRTDAAMIRSLRNSLLNDKSKDGLARDLFPLTSEEQKDYEFKLLGQEVEAGRDVYHIAFAPKDKGEPTWAGEAFIDAAELQPVRVFTKMSRRIPLLGADDVVRSAWIWVQRGLHSAGGRSVVSFELRDGVPDALWAPVLLQSRRFDFTEEFGV